MVDEHKQKVLMVHNYYQIPGGEDTVVANEKRLLEEHGHIVVLYTRHNNELKSMNKLQKIALPFTTIFNPRTYRDIKRIIREENIEIVHVHNTLNLISPAVYYAAVKCGVPVVQTIHNFRFLCPGATFYRDGHICEDCVSKGLKCAVKHKCYRHSRALTFICVISTWLHRHTGILGKINFIALTEFNKEKLLQLKQIKQNRAYIKPNFTFDVRIESNEEQKNETDKQCEYYLFAGRIEEIKGIKILIEAFKDMPYRLLKLAGDGPLFEEYQKMCSRNELRNVMFLGRIRHNVLLRYMRDAKAVILPTQVYEGFPMIIPEAYSTGTPIVAGEIGNAGSLVREGFTGAKFTYDSSKSLQNAIDRFENYDFDYIRENAKKEYEDLYSADSNYRILVGIYNCINCTKGKGSL